VLLPAVVNPHLNALISSLSKEIERFTVVYGSRNAHLELECLSAFAIAWNVPSATPVI